METQIVEKKQTAICNYMILDDLDALLSIFSCPFMTSGRSLHSWRTVKLLDQEELSANLHSQCFMTEQTMIKALFAWKSSGHPQHSEWSCCSSTSPCSPSLPSNQRTQPCWPIFPLRSSRIKVDGLLLPFRMQNERSI